MNTAPTADRVRAAVATVLDPELPVVTIADLGVLREVAVEEDGTVRVDLTPTYSGCPAMETMRADVERALADLGVRRWTVRTVLAPAWSTDDITEAGREKLRGFGVAPPHRVAGPTPVSLSVRCPRCHSRHTREVSRFGSTACKALWTCVDCGEPFDQIKSL